LEDLSHILTNGIESDFAFIVEGESIPVHKSILAERCGYFQIMFSSGMKEQNGKNVDLEDTSKSILKEILSYIYTENLDINDENVIDIWILAHRWRIFQLKQLCEDFVHENLDVSNICSLYQLADMYDSMALKLECQTFIKANWTQIKKEEDFVQLDEKTKKSLKNSQFQK